VTANEPLIPQVERWAQEHNASLPDAWKVELAKRAKQIALSRGISAFDDAVIQKWVGLFEAFAEGG
jgi:hypothetical protein